MAGAMLENKTFDEIAVGDSASIRRQVTWRDIELFAVVSGDINPAHLDADFAKDDRFHGIIAHGLLGGALISAVLGTKLPGPGTIYLGQDLKFLKPVRPGDTIEATLTVSGKDAAKKTVTLDCRCVNQAGQDVITGHALVIAPAEKIRRPAPDLPDVEIHRHGE
jgi:acyl dehydratase